MSLRPLSVRPLLAVLFSIALVTLFSARAADKASTRPNIILILTDDMGFGDVGCYGGKFALTPLSIDARCRWRIDVGISPTSRSATVSGKGMNLKFGSSTTSVRLAITVR